MNSLKLACALALMSPFALAPALAEDSKPTDEAFIQRLYARAPEKQMTYACFVRAYDAAHLASHPKQKVSAMKLLVTAEKIPEDAKLNHSFNLGLKYRTRKGDFDSSGECGHVKVGEDESNKEPRLGCSVDCDGGGFSVELSKDNKSVLLRVERVRIWRDDKPDEDASYDLEGGADDRVFRLDRADLSQCRALIRDRKELVSLRSK